MAFRHTFQVLRSTLGHSFIALFLCFSLTGAAEPSGTVTKAHTGDSSDKKTSDKAGVVSEAPEKIRKGLEKAPSGLLSALTQSLSRAKPDLSSEEFSKLVDAALEKSGAESKQAKEAAEALKKVFKEDKDELGERPVGEVTALVAEELADRLSRPDNNGDKPEEKPDGKPENKPNEELEKIRKQLADVEQLGKKLEEEKAKKDKKDAARAADGLNGLGNKGAGGGEGSGSGGGSGDSGGGSPSGDTGGEENSQPPAQNPTAGEKLRALAELLSKSTSGSEDSAAPEDDSDSDTGTGSSSGKKSGLSSVGDLLDDKASESSDKAADTEPTAEATAQTTQPTAQPQLPSPKPLPAKTSLPTIANDPVSGAASLTGLDTSNQAFAGGAVTSSTTTTNTTSNGFSDTVFSSVGGGLLGAVKKINYKYLRALDYGSSNEGGGTSSATQGGYGSSQPQQASSIYETAPPAQAAENSRGVFGYLSRTVESLCSSGTLICNSNMEKQP